MKLSMYSFSTQKILIKSQMLAKKYLNQYVEPEHLLFILLKENKILDLLKKFSVSKNKIFKDIQIELIKLPNVDISITSLSIKLKKLMLNAEIIAAKNLNVLVNNEHVLAAMVDPEFFYCQSATNLNKNGVTKEKIIAYIEKKTKLPIKSSLKLIKANSSKILEQFSCDLIKKAKDGFLDPLIGRDLELRRILQILLRKDKFNPILIGDPGVGKNTIINGLAIRISLGDVPSILLGKEIRSLDVYALLAGTSLRGQFEERLNEILNELKNSSGKILLFINEIHTLVGAGGGGASDAANILKPSLARGEIQVLGTCTLSEYKKNIEKDPALNRRFQPVFINEQNSNEVLQILRGIKKRYEIFHNITISDTALEAAISFSIRYITNKALPDKAIDLIDEACSDLRLSENFLPEILDKEQRSLTQKKIEKKSLENNKTLELNKLRLKKSIKIGEKRIAILKSHWKTELDLTRTLKLLKKDISNIQNEILKKKNLNLTEKEIKIKYKILKKIKNNFKIKSKALYVLQKKMHMVKDQVVASDIVKIVAFSTGIPLHRMLENEKEKLVQMETRLSNRVIGQLEAIIGVSHSIRRSRAGIQDLGKPLGSFLFLGPTGVGKTELAKAVSDFLFDNEKSIIRFDMSEFMEKHSVARLIGAPPGYKGSDEGGQLTESIRRKPYSLILFDEIEKAHPDILNILLQVLDDGHLSDSKGCIINFCNTVIIMTSNIGSCFLLETTIENNKISVNAKKQVLLELKNFFKPEFLNRIDEIVMFHALTLSEIGKIANIQLEKLNNLLMLQQIKIAFSLSAKKELIKAGFEPSYGARPLKRAIQRLIQNPLSLLLLNGTFKAKDSIIVKIKKNKKNDCKFYFSHNN